MTTAHDAKLNEEKTAAIRTDIARTRGNMARTVNAIEERLNPAHIKEQVADIKQAALGQYHEAKDHLKEDISKELREAKEKVQDEIQDAKTKVQEEIQQARTAVREATVGRVEHMVHDARETVTDAGTSVVDTIKANPVPAALVAIGLGWLLVGGRRSGARRLGQRQEHISNGGGYGYGYAESRDERGRGPRGALRQAEEGISEVGHSVQEGAGQVASQASGVIHDVGEKVNHLAHDAAGAIGHAASDAKNAAVSFAGDARTQGRRVVRGAGRQARRAGQSFEGMLRDNPLAVGAVAVAIGATIGVLLPSTQREDAWMGGTKERLLERAEELAEGALHKVEDTVTHQLAAAEVSRTEGAASKSSEKAGRAMSEDEGAPTSRNGMSNGFTSKAKPKTSSL